MADISVSNKLQLDASSIGAVICRTPITPPATIENNIEHYNTCKLIRSLDQLVSTFGDPFIDPPEYTDLVLVYDLIRLGTPVYVSSLDDMSAADDEFSIASYNGYTEFMYVDSTRHDTVGYKLKSNVKMCQPVIQYEILKNRLTLNVSLYYIDRSLYHDFDYLSKIDKSRLYKTIQLIFNLDTVTDKDICDTMLKHGLELIVTNADSENNRSFVDELIRHRKLVLSNNDTVLDGVVTSKDYWYNLHSNSFSYDLDTFDKVEHAYFSAINAIADQSPAPHFLCLGKLFESKTSMDASDNITRSRMRDLDPYSYNVIHSYLLGRFSEDCDTYLFISMPDITVSSALSLLSTDNQSNNVYLLPDQFNCDIYYGYAGDFIDRSLSYDSPLKVFYSASLLTLYSVLLTGSPYVTNSVGGLNISNGSVKVSITEDAASKLTDNRCNSVVLFDSGYPSIHGDRSLSTLPNLRYSHASRNFVRIRRLIREFLETRKFTINTAFNAQSCINYIRSEILDTFKDDGIITDYDIQYSIERQTVNINIILIFSQVAESISLEFVI